MEFLELSTATALIDTFLQGPEAHLYDRPVAFPITVIDVDGKTHRAEVIPAGFEFEGVRGWVVTVTRLDDQSPALTALHQIVRGSSLEETAQALARRLTYRTADGLWSAVVGVEPETESGGFVFGQPGTQTEEVLRSALASKTHLHLWSGIEANGCVLVDRDDLPSAVAQAMDADDTHQLLIMRVDTSAGLGMVLLQFINDRHRGNMSGNTHLYLTELQTVLVRAVEREIGMRALAEQARRDPLTGLLNRSGLASDNRRSETPTTLIFLDLDHFKVVNDTFGHKAGDAVLIEVANRLRWASRPDDLVVRLGGDEFVVVARTTNLDDAREIADRLAAAVSQKLPPDTGPDYVTASIGVTTFDHLQSISDALAAADEAMLRAKKTGRGRIVATASKHETPL